MSLKKPSHCTVLVRDNALEQVEKIEYLEMAFTSDGRQNEA